MMETIKDSGERREYQRHQAGDKYGKLTLVERMPGGQKWRCVCECGAEVITQISRGSRACAKCAYQENGKNRTTHGESPNKTTNATRLYEIWTGMRNRCKNPKNKCYKDYGGRGISVCSEWNSYIEFKQWALSNGYQDNLSIDRIDNNGNYEPNNCRWVIQTEQMRNMRRNRNITIEGETKCVMDWCNHLQISKSRAYCEAKSHETPIEEYIKSKYYSRKE